MTDQEKKCTKCKLSYAVNLFICKTRRKTNTCVYCMRKQLNNDDVDKCNNIVKKLNDIRQERIELLNKMVKNFENKSKCDSINSKYRVDIGYYKENKIDALTQLQRFDIHDFISYVFNGLKSNSIKNTVGKCDYCNENNIKELELCHVHTNDKFDIIEKVINNNIENNEFMYLYEFKKQILREHTKDAMLILCKKCHKIYDNNVIYLEYVI